MDQPVKLTSYENISNTYNVSIDKDKFIDNLREEYKAYRKSFKLAGKLKGGIYVMQGLVAISVLGILIPTVALTPVIFMVLIASPSCALLISPLKTLPRKDKLGMCMMHFMYLIDEAEKAECIDIKFLAFYQKSRDIFEKSPMYCKPYEIYKVRKRDPLTKSKCTVP